MPRNYTAEALALIANPARPELVAKREYARQRNEKWLAVILEQNAAGWSDRRIGSALDVNKQTVCTIREAYGIAGASKGGVTAIVDPEEDVAAIRAVRRLGTKIKDIAAAVGVDVSMVRRVIARDSGRGRGGDPIWNDTNTAILRSMWPDAASISIIAKRLNVAVKTVQLRAHAIGLPPRVAALPPPPPPPAWARGADAARIAAGWEPLPAGHPIAVACLNQPWSICA